MRVFFCYFFNLKKLNTNMLFIRSGVVNFFLMPVVLGCVFGTNLLKADPLPCDVSAFIAYLINAEDGKVLFSKNGELELHPASTTKIATALYTLQKKNVSLDQVVTVSQESVGAVPVSIRRAKGPSHRLEFGGTHIGLQVGEKIDLHSLLYGLMLPSGNDAANVIAEAVSGSIPQFMLELNAFLQFIGCKNTHFTNPHGLSDKEHVTTAKDLATMARFALKNPNFRKIVTSKKFIRPMTNKQPETVLAQGNALVKPGSKHYYPHATGLKTGYTAWAGHTIVASAEKGDRSLIAVICHREGVAKRYRSAIQLFETAFNEPKQTRTLFSAEHDLFHKEIEGSKDVLKAALSKDLTVSFYPSEEKKYHSEIEWKNLSLPIEEGTLAGNVLIYDELNRLQEAVPIYAMKKIQPTFLYKAQKAYKKASRGVYDYRAYVAYLIGLTLLFGAFWWIFRRKKVDI
jgi:serine-type D-Ala-D-Ala carboxypeptidase (penicillin-binding protein 5/6)